MYETIFHANAKEEYFRKLAAQYIPDGQVMSFIGRRKRERIDPFVNKGYFVGKEADAVLHRLAAAEALLELLAMPTAVLSDLSPSTLRLTDGRRRGQPIIDQSVSDVLTVSRVIGDSERIQSPKKISPRVDTARRNIAARLQGESTLPLNLKDQMNRDMEGFVDVVRGYTIYRYLAASNGFHGRPSKTQLWYTFMNNPLAIESIHEETYGSSLGILSIRLQ